ncbi:MAG: terminase large subunit [Candidatus Puniceispirillaceae bacterium]
MMNKPTKADWYAEEVLAGRIVACELVRLACKRYQNDRASGKWQFDEDLAQHAVSFIEALTHTTGEAAGRPFILEPWQEFIVWNIFGFVGPDGGRRFSRAYVEVPRKNGKSTFSSALMLYGLLADGESGAQVYSAATKLDQAMMVFGESVRMVRAQDWLHEECNVYNSINNRRITHAENLYKPLEWNPGKQDGLNTHFAVIDEYHAHPNDELYNVIFNSMGARRQPLLFTITTAGFNRESPCFKHRQYCSQVLQGGIEDDALFSVVYTLDPGDDWMNPEVWAKANPNWGVSVYPKKLEQAIAEAKELAHKEVEFKTKLLNVWTDTAQTWIQDAVWMANGQGDPFELADLEGCECFGGLDLAQTGDFCAFSLYFPTEGQVVTRYYLPEDAVRKRTDAAGQSIKQWVRDGLVIQTDGNVTDYSFIKADVLQLAERFAIREIAFDRYNSSQLIIELQNEGLTMFPFGQGFASMAAPTKEFERLVRVGQIKHGGNPVTRWMMSNILLKRDPAGNVKIDKAKSGDKVDGPVSIVMALGTYMQEAAKNQNSDFWYISI